MSALSGPEILELLTHGSMDIEGRLTEASNMTLRAIITLDGMTERCVYKPVRGERPLWDFPDGTLAGREVSAYLVGAATGWSPVPPTVLRDGPMGPGACQLWIDVADASDDAPDGEPEAADAAGRDSNDRDLDDCDLDADDRRAAGAENAPATLLGFVPAWDVPEGWRRIASARDDEGNAYVLGHADDTRLARLAAFDVVVNNADRKGGHILIDATGHVYGVDHGISFHVENKLRTILWGWIGERLPDDVVEVLTRLRSDLGGDLGDALHEHLMRAEVTQAKRRIDRLLRTGTYPAPSDDWPAVPWPPI